MKKNNLRHTKDGNNLSKNNLRNIKLDWAGGMGVVGCCPVQIWYGCDAYL